MPVMKLLAVNWRDLKNPEAGGAEVHLQEILTRMAGRGHQVTLFAAGYPGGPAEETCAGIRVIRRGNWYNANYVLPFAIRAHLKNNSYDLIIEDINKIPCFLPLFVKQKVLAVIPHLFGATVFRETNPLLASYVYLWEKFIPRVYRASRFVAISPSTREDLIQRGIKAERIDVSLCGLDHQTFRRLEGVRRFDEPTLIHFGRIRKYKGIDTVIKAFAGIREAVPNARLIIAGDGPDRAELEALTTRMNLNRSIDFLGMVPIDKLIELLNKCHLFLNASAKEGWGLTVVEANACGMPVIASNRPGLKDSVKHEKTGYLVEYGRPAAFAARAVELLSDQAKWQAMSEAALDWARSLTWDRNADEMEKIFLEEVS